MIKKIKQGFTLIELLVTTGIILIIVTIGLASYNRFNERQTVVQTANDLKNNFRLVQNKALTGEKVCGTGINKCGGEDDDSCDNDPGEIPLSGWEIEFSAGNYKIRGRCGSNVFSEKTIKLISSVTFSPLPSSVIILFLPLTKGVSSQINLCLVSNQTQQYRYKLILKTNGEVVDNGFVSSCP